jgi:hypothetical protein
MRPAAKYRPIATGEAFVTRQIIAAGQKLAEGSDHPDAQLWKPVERTAEIEDYSGFIAMMRFQFRIP